VRNKLLEARGERSQIDVATALNISQQYLSKIERGQRDPGLKMAFTFSKFYNKPVWELFPDLFPDIKNSADNER
jgi:transcriptional regulator with XRE-family HTH domain